MLFFILPVLVNQIWLTLYYNLILLLFSPLEILKRYSDQVQEHS